MCKVGMGRGNKRKRQLEERRDKKHPRNYINYGICSLFNKKKAIPVLFFIMHIFISYNLENADLQLDMF